MIFIAALSKRTTGSGRTKKKLEPCNVVPRKWKLSQPTLCGDAKAAFPTQQQHCLTANTTKGLFAGGLFGENVRG